jgi:hypothetical protein
MLHVWWCHLATPEVRTPDEWLQLLALPDPSDTVALKQIGLARVEITSSKDSLSVWFHEPLVFDEVVAVFGQWRQGVRGPDNFFETPCCYKGSRLGDPRFTFFVQSKQIVSESGAFIWIDVCPRLHFTLPMGEPIVLPSPTLIVTPPVGRFRSWLRWLRRDGEPRNGNGR